MHRRAGSRTSEERPIGGSVFAGIANAFRSPYLLGVSLFILLFAITSTFLYFQQAAIVSRSFTDRGAQTAFFATVDLAVNVLTLGVQLFLDRADRRCWLGVGADARAAAGADDHRLRRAGGRRRRSGAIAVFQVLRRAGDYAIARPTREVLFTVVPREDRYKAKSFIDTVVYRFGDQVGAWTVPLLRGFGPAPAWRWSRSRSPLCGWSTRCGSAGARKLLEAKPEATAARSRA